MKKGLLLCVSLFMLGGCMTTQERRYKNTIDSVYNLRHSLVRYTLEPTKDNREFAEEDAKDVIINADKALKVDGYTPCQLYKIRVAKEIGVESYYMLKR